MDYKAVTGPMDHAQHHGHMEHQHSDHHGGHHSDHHMEGHKGATLDLGMTDGHSQVGPMAHMHNMHIMSQYFTWKSESPFLLKGISIGTKEGILCAMVFAIIIAVIFELLNIKGQQLLRSVFQRAVRRAADDGDDKYSGWRLW